MVGFLAPFVFAACVAAGSLAVRAARRRAEARTYDAPHDLLDSFSVAPEPRSKRVLVRLQVISGRSSTLTVDAAVAHVLSSQLLRACAEARRETGGSS